MSKKVIVIGAGAAGLIAAGKAAQKGFEVLICEKNDRVGKKLLITGKGRCNITNSTDINGLIENIPGNGNFLYSAFNSFSNHDLINLLNTLGLKTKVERGNRVFPESDKAKDVVDALLKFVDKNNVTIKYKSSVKDIKTEDMKVTGVTLKDGTFIKGDCVILATGGASYPGTGSTGEGYDIAKRLGHKIIDIKPSLVPLISNDNWVPELQGLSLKNVSVKFMNSKNKKVYEDFGEMLFTHFGVSGPVILSASRHLLSYDYKNLKLIIDLKPALSDEKLSERVLRDFEKNSRKQFKNSLDELLPQKLIPVIIKLSGIPEDRFVNQIKKDERKILLNLLKNLELNINGARAVEEAIVTAGGIAINEINPKTMESKLIKNLYFAGEVIDVDGYTGGFNLTIAFSTGYLAGQSCLD